MKTARLITCLALATGLISCTGKQTRSSSSQAGVAQKNDNSSSQEVKSKPGLKASGPIGMLSGNVLDRGAGGAVVVLRGQKSNGENFSGVYLLRGLSGKGTGAGAEAGVVTLSSPNDLIEGEYCIPKNAGLPLPGNNVHWGVGLSSTSVQFERENGATLKINAGGLGGGYTAFEGCVTITSLFVKENEFWPSPSSPEPELQPALP